MKTRRSIIPVAALAVSTASSNAMGQARMFLQTPTASAVTAPPDGIRIEAHGGDILTFWVMGERSPVNVRGCQVMLPCQAAGGAAGTIRFVAPPIVNTSNPAFLYYGLGSFPVTDNGACPAPPPPNDGNPRIATAASMTPPQPMFHPRYLGEFVYTVSWDARGEFVIDIPNEPGSAIRDGSDMPILFTTSGATIVVREGQCCVHGACEGVMTRAACDAVLGDWRPNQDCNDPCECDSDAACLDNNPCTVDRCLGALCELTVTQFGNADGVGPDYPTVDDLLCAIQALTDPSACPNADLYPPCYGDGVYDSRDVELLRSAFSGADPCGCAAFTFPPPRPPLSGPARVFLQRAATGASSTPLEGLRVEVQGGEVSTLWTLLEQFPLAIGDAQAMLPCTASGGQSGSVYFVPPASVQLTNPAWVFYGTNYAPLISNGTCPAPPPPDPGNPRVGPRSYGGWYHYPPQLIRAPRFFAEFSYYVSNDAEGEFLVEPANEPGSVVLDAAAFPVSFVTSGVTLVARTGQCCVGGACQGVMTRAACAGVSGTWRPNRSCEDGCGCSADGDCRDDLPCTRDQCIDGACVHEPVAFGDADGIGPDHATMDDVMCVIRGLADPSSCPGADLYPPCLTDGVIDERDVDWVLRAFRGEDPCGCTR